MLEDRHGLNTPYDKPWWRGILLAVVVIALLGIFTFTAAKGTDRYNYTTIERTN